MKAAIFAALLTLQIKLKNQVTEVKATFTIRPFSLNLGPSDERNSYHS